MINKNEGNEEKKQMSINNANTFKKVSQLLIGSNLDKWNKK